MRKEIILILILSIATFFIITGGKILNPNFIDWLILNKEQISDNEMHLLGWLFFKETPFFQFPLLLIPNLGEGLNISLVYTDSIPLMAILFKILKNFLSDNFQYFGIWILICFILQGVFSYLILSKFINDRNNKILATLLFLLAPTFLFRFQLGHFALLGHWIILASILLYCTNRFDYKKWLLVIIASLLIHPYLFGMVLGIFLADVLQNLIKNTHQYKIIIMKLLLVAAVTTSSLFVLGHIDLNSINNLELYGGYGHFKMNLLSIVDPAYNLLGKEISWSRLFPDLPNQDWRKTFADYEGFNYLGIALITLIILVSFKIKQFKLDIKSRTGISFFLPLIIISFLLFIFSISNNITAGGSLVFHYILPEKLIEPFNVFRASGRFFWPVYYLLYFFIIILFTRCYKTKHATLILVVIVSLQVFDTFPSLKDINQRLNKESSSTYWSSKLKNSFWSNLPERYTKITYVFPFNQPTKSFELLYFASKNNLSTNFGYWFKDTKYFYSKEKKRLQNQILMNEFEDYSIYYFHDLDAWTNIINNKGPQDYAKEIDGYKIYAPNFFSEK